MHDNIKIVPNGTKRSLLVSAIALALGANAAMAQSDTQADSDSALLAIAGAADSNPARRARRTQRMEEIEVEGQAPVAPSSPKYTQPLLDTPQSIAVVPNEVIKGQNLLSLRDILSTLPGITFGAGEGGGGYGDSINLRGFTANNDIAIDGVRDSAQYSRTDPFNLEQLEVINGANSVYSGSSSVGGTINLVTKRAQDDDFTRIAGGAGTDSYGRVTVDSNQQINDSTAVRLNVMTHQNDVPGRDVETFERWGIAPSITFGLDSDTRVSLSYVHQEDDNIPQYGVPFYNGAPLPGVDSSSYFGYRNVDTQEIDTDVFTAIIDHAFSDTFSVRNLTRQGEADQLSIVNPPQGTYCLDSGINPATGAACNAPGTFTPITPTGPRGNLRDTTNSVLANQTDFLIDFHTGAIEHNAVVGFSIARESFDLGTGNIQRSAAGVAPVYPAMDLSDPDNF
jgi:catecholate siderophore receptor